MKSIDLKNFIFLLISTLLFTTSILTAQEKSEEEQNTYDLALNYFNNKKYDKAIPYLTELLKLYSKDPMYNYYYGICLLETGQIIKSIDYLRFAASKEVPVMVYFYLGRAYHLDYQFNKAITFYKRFEFNTDPKELEPYQTKRLINMCYNAIYLMKYVPKVETVEKKTLNINDFYKSYNLTNIDGKLIEKPTKLKSVEEIEKNEKSIMFIPHVIEDEEIVYYSGYSEENGKDIFMIKKTGENKWSDPQNLSKIINSPYDEDYPFFDATNSVLYFCSKGHYSMGGYDIYKSYYSIETESWSPPENLDFPINSPFDDILFITDIYGTNAVFASLRESQPDYITIYKIKLTDRSEQIEVEDYNEIKQMAKLQVEGETEEIETEFKSPLIQDKQDYKKPDKQIEEFETRYNVLLNKALEYQLKADSLNLAIINMRKEYIETTDQKEKNDIRKIIQSMENQKKQIDDLANQKFTEVKKLETSFIAKNVNLYTKDNKIKKTQREKFLELPEIQNLFGLKGIKKFIEINEKVIDNVISIEEVNKNESQIKELKELLKAEKDPKKDKKITKAIQKLEKEIYSTNYKSYQAIHKNIVEKYELYNEKIPEAKQFQENDLMLELANDYINKAINSTQQSNTIYQKIDKYESENYIINKLKEADSIDLRSLEYMELAILSYFNYEIGEDEPEIDKEIEYAKVDKEMVSDSLKMDTIPEPPKVADSEINPDTLAQALEIINNVELENIQNLEKAVQNENTSLHISKEFEILKKSPYSESNPFPIDQKLPKGINYRIQLGVYSQSMPFDSFKGLCPISIENTPNGYLKYYAGSFKRYQSAVNSLSLVRDEGFKDAFIVAFQDGIKISTDKAKGLELKDAPVINPQKPQVKDTIETKDDEIVIKIQIGAFKGQMPEDIFENFKNLAPGKIFEQYVNENGIRIYTIGNFYNFEEAQNLKKYIQEKGNDGIFLIALKNGKKIPVSEAKELLKEKR